MWEITRSKCLCYVGGAPPWISSLCMRPLIIPTTIVVFLRCSATQRNRNPWMLFGSTTGYLDVWLILSKACNLDAVMWPVLESCLRVQGFLQIHIVVQWLNVAAEIKNKETWVIDSHLLAPNMGVAVNSGPHTKCDRTLSSPLLPNFKYSRAPVMCWTPWICRVPTPQLPARLCTYYGETRMLFGNICKIAIISNKSTALILWSVKCRTQGHAICQCSEKLFSVIKWFDPSHTDQLKIQKRYFKKNICAAMYSLTVIIFPYSAVQNSVPALFYLHHNK